MGPPLLQWSRCTGDFSIDVTACPPEQRLTEGKLRSGKICVCKDPMKEWNGYACCVPNSHWNGTACECDINHNLQQGLCCHKATVKGWGTDRCGCFNGSTWNGNSCLPGWLGFLDMILNVSLSLLSWTTPLAMWTYRFLFLMFGIICILSSCARRYSVDDNLLKLNPDRKQSCKSRQLRTIMQSRPAYLIVPRHMEPPMKPP
jgi:hypothetical protein